jgi:hypothetical protein
MNFSLHFNNRNNTDNANHSKNIANYYNSLAKKLYIYPNPSNIVIPLEIYQTWHSEDLPNSVSRSIEDIKRNNPEFKHNLYNEELCRNYIKDNYNKQVLDAYNNLVPHALKADLWRYCILYKKGGIYLDAKYHCIHNFKFIYLTQEEYFCKDIDESGSGIYNALIIVKPGNPIILKCIQKVIENISKKFYGTSSLEPTGPLMMKSFFSQDEIFKLKLKLQLLGPKDNELVYVTCNNLPILTLNKNYRNEQKIHWTYYWDNKIIYKEDIDTHEKVFSAIYENEVWGKTESIYYKGSSGEGSSIEEQINTYVPFLKNFIKEKNITTICDLGCGNFKCGKLIYDDLDIKYTGYEIYKKVVDNHIYNNMNYNKDTPDKYKFIYLDIFNKKEEIQSDFDLIILKDILMHWDLKTIYTFLDYMTTTKKGKYILLVNSGNQLKDNTDIITGMHRPLSANFYPLKKYNPVIIYKYEPDSKEVSLITL